MNKLHGGEPIDLFQSGQTTLDEAFKVFDVIHKVVNNKAALFTATLAVIEEFAEDNVIYLELRTTPRQEADMSEDVYIDTVIRAIQESSSDIIVKLILSIDRRRNYQEQSSTIDTILRWKTQYPDIIRGVDFSGDPSKGTFYVDLFEKARKNGLYVALHCAEVRNDREVEEMLKFKPDRLGHCIFLHPSYIGTSDIWALYTSLRIPVEFCLSSNLICGSVESFQKHPVGEWIKDNLPFCISTDDKGCFLTSTTEEFCHLQDAFKLTERQMWEISKNSVNYSFATPAEKSILHQKLEDWAKEKLNI